MTTPNQLSGPLNASATGFLSSGWPSLLRMRLVEKCDVQRGSGRHIGTGHLSNGEWHEGTVGHDYCRAFAMSENHPA
jgi:hypothetical protein